MKIDRDLQERIQKAVTEKIEIVKYNPQWPERFEKEANYIKSKFPTIVKRIEHFGSTSIKNLSAKPIIDMLVEVSSYKDVKKYIVPFLTRKGYEYFWRPEFDKPPMYAWFIKRDKKGNRTHHLHMVIKNSKLWERLLFRDYLKMHPKLIKDYEELKIDLSKKFSNNRELYTKAKTEFIQKVTKKAKIRFT